MNQEDLDIHRRITALVESLRDDREQSGELFNYVWTMMCVRRELMTVVGEIRSGSRSKIIVEDGKGNRRSVIRPLGLDGEVESLAVQALDHILATARKAG